MDFDALQHDCSCILDSFKIESPQTNKFVKVFLFFFSSFQCNFFSSQYYILLTNFVFMGIVPSGIMIVFNVLVVRAVNEANKRRAR